MKIFARRILRRFLVTAFLAGLLLNLGSCYLLAGSAAVEVSFDNVGGAAVSTTSRSAYRLETPSVFDIKIAAVYLSEDIDPVTGNNTGYTPMIYLNPKCNGDVRTYDVNDLEYFHFARSSAEVNEQINATAEPVPALTYRYVRIEFYKDEPEGEDYKNARWGTDAFSKEFFRGGGVITVAFDEPLVVQDGQSVRVVLEYDPADTIAVTDPEHPVLPPDFISDDYYDDGDTHYEFMLPAFHPRAEIVQ